MLDLLHRSPGFFERQPCIKYGFWVVHAEEDGLEIFQEDSTSSVRSAHRRTAPREVC